MNRVMQKVEDPLNLRSLPALDPPRDGWPAIETALQRDRRRAGARRFAFSALAAAATVTLALWVILQQPDDSTTGETARSAPARPSVASAAPDEAAAAAGPRAGESLDALIALSQRLEGRLRTMRDELGDLPAGLVVYQVELEDLIVQMDEELSNQPDSLSLWNQRVNLLMDVERLYANRLRREYRQMASL